MNKSLSLLSGVCVELNEIAIRLGVKPVEVPFLEHFAGTEVKQEQWRILAATELLHCASRLVVAAHVVQAERRAYEYTQKNALNTPPCKLQDECN